MLCSHYTSTFSLASCHREKRDREHAEHMARMEEDEQVARRERLILCELEFPFFNTYL